MRRREVLVFIAAFVVVLLGGAALAQVGTFSSSPASDAAAMSAQPAADDLAPATTKAVEVLLPAEDVADTVGLDEEPKEEVPKDEPPADKPPAEEPPKDEPPAEEPPKEDPPKEEEDTTPPSLEILFPENEQHFDEDTIPFEGKTEPGARVFAGRYEADVDEEGNWRIVLILNPGGNVVTFKAKDSAGNITEKAVKVYLDRETDTAFTAHQKWEVVDGSPAVNVYYGTAQPGTKIWVGNRFGSGETKANDKGQWELRVKFREAPCNETFGVVVESGDHRKEFRMKYVCAANDFTAHQKYGENESPWTKFYGTGVPGTTVWAVSDYGSAETIVGSNGEWLLKLHFNDELPPNKEIDVVVEGEGGRAEFVFYWVVAEAEEIDFTANQKYGSCGEAVPYDKFFGTANPEATIWVESDWGGGVTTANKHGEWHIRVEFPDAPVNTPFTVYIESSDGGYAEFTFVRTAGDEH
ncbi:MAG: hypothetical protein QNJ89_09035 [Acidimicrobiia bacterium]|nr:hypothetical protein [Acidimicrobiia bacterium]